MAVEKLDIGTALAGAEDRIQVASAATGVAVPDEIERKITYAWVAAVVAACITLAAALLAMSGSTVPGFSPWQLVDVAVIAILAAGIFRRSRACAVAMFVYFLVCKLLMIAEAGVTPGLGSGMALGVVFAYCYWQGIAGTYAWHRIRHRQS